MGVTDVAKPNIPKPATVVMDDNSSDESGLEAVRGADGGDQYIKVEPNLREQISEGIRR